MSDYRPAPRYSKPIREHRVLAHQGRLTGSEHDSLKNCLLNGDRPYPNLIEADYAALNEKTNDWYLKEAGYQKLREYTIFNKTEVIHS
jgi:hypothetical protein